MSQEFGWHGKTGLFWWREHRRSNRGRPVSRGTISVMIGQFRRALASTHNSFWWWVSILESDGQLYVLIRINYLWGILSSAVLWCVSWGAPLTVTLNRGSDKVFKPCCGKIFLFELFKKKGIPSSSSPWLFISLILQSSFSLAFPSLGPDWDLQSSGLTRSGRRGRLPTHTHTHTTRAAQREAVCVHMHHFPAVY